MRLVVKSAMSAQEAQLALRCYFCDLKQCKKQMRASCTVGAASRGHDYMPFMLATQQAGRVRGAASAACPFPDRAHFIPAQQVGSKNAAFFMGRAVKVCTKRAGDRKVHQLCIDAEKLEDRYRKQEVSAVPGQSFTASTRQQ